MKYAVPSEKGISELTSRMSSAMSGKAPDDDNAADRGEEDGLGAEADGGAKAPQQPKTTEEAMSMSVKELKEAVR